MSENGAKVMDQTEEAVPVPAVGDRVLYTLSQNDAEAINRRRADAGRNLKEHRENANGVQIHVGNTAHEGDVYPMTIIRVWGNKPNSLVNGQVMLDGNDLYWATSVEVGTGPRTFAWSARA